MWREERLFWAILWLRAGFLWVLDYWAWFLYTAIFLTVGKGVPS